MKEFPKHKKTKYYKKHTLFEKVVYALTEKPTEYVHIDTPKTLQDYRQIGFNRWCKAIGVYSGSYLPADPEKLTSNGRKGWYENTSSKNKTGDNRIFVRKSTGQIVRHDDTKTKRNGTTVDQHYHWHNEKQTQDIAEYLQMNNIELSKKEQSEKFKYKDRYGHHCDDGSKESHLAPRDSDYRFRR